MKQSATLGILSGMGLVTGMVFLSPEQAMAFFNLPGLILVGGGTLAATLVSRPAAEVLGVVRRVPVLISEGEVGSDEHMGVLMRVADWLRRGNIRAAEKEAQAVPDLFLRSGLQLILDRTPKSELVRLMRWHISGIQGRDAEDAAILRTMGAFAPAFGMLGTLFGLVHMLYGLGAGALADLGVTMGFALVSTLYGIVAANLLFKPLALKLERRVQREHLRLNVALEGMLLLYERRNPALIRETLENLISYHQGAPLGLRAPLPASA
jgi:chemotaxis protein MotA